MAGQGDEQSNAARTRELNDTIRYTMWSVFRLERPLGPADGGAARAAEAAEVEGRFGKLAADDVSCAAPTTSRASGRTPTSWSGGTPRRVSSSRRRTTGCGARRSAGA